MSIHDISNKIKAIIPIDIDSILMCCLVIFVGISAFFLGRLSVQKNDLKIDNYNQSNTIGNNITAQASSYSVYKKTTGNKSNSNISNLSNGIYVASKRGKLYYRVGCGGAKNIVEINKIYFNSSLEAERAGYSPAKKCTP